MSILDKLKDVLARYSNEPTSHYIEEDLQECIEALEKGNPMRGKSFIDLSILRELNPSGIDRLNMPEPLFQPVPNKLKVVHYAQIPCKPFEVEVANEHEAYLVLNALANQHLFLLEENIIPDYSNIVCVVMWDTTNMECDGSIIPDWVDYWNDEEGMDWDEFSSTYLDLE